MYWACSCYVANHNSLMEPFLEFHARLIN